MKVLPGAWMNILPDTEKLLKPEPLNIVSYFVRHGTTAGNEQKRFRGWIDIPLDEKGFSDARKVEAFFRDKPLGDAWSSDMKRALSTAEITLDPRGISFEEDEDLSPLNTGHFAGEKKDYHLDDMEYYQRNPDIKIPGGESINEFRQRVKTPILRAISKGITNKEPSIIFTHSSVIHEVNNIIHHDHNANLVKPGGVIGVEFSGNKFKVHQLLKPHKPTNEPYAS